jgi:hypothetical protein
MRAAFRLNRNAHILQDGDVTPHRARIDFQPAGDFYPTDVVISLQKRQHSQQARCW